MAVRLVPDSYATIALALAAAGAGDEIQMRAGAYHENNLLVASGTATLVRPFPGDEGLVTIDGDDAAFHVLRVQASNCVVQDLIFEGAGLNNYCVSLNNATQTVQRCVFLNTTGGGVTSTTNNHTISRCTFAVGKRAVTTTGIGGTVVNCLTVGGTHGICAGASVTVRHCTVIGASTRGYELLFAAVVRNSVAYGCAGDGFHLGDAGCSVDYCLSNGNGTNWDVVAGTLGANVWTTDPLFVDAGAGDYRPGVGSPLLHAATALGITEDLNGDTRPVGAGPDIGAYEWQSTPPVVVSGVADGFTTVRVVFDQDVDGADDDPADWTIDALSGGDAVTVAAVAYDAASYTATLATSAHSPDQVYRVTAPATVENLYGDVLNPAQDDADYLTQRASGRESANPWAATGDAMTVDVGAGPFELVPWSASAPLSSLEQAVWISLFTDRRAADDDQLPDAAGDPPYRGGWWADALAGEEGPTGSRLWLLRREPVTDETIPLVEEYAAEALEWLVAGGYVAAVAVSAARPGPEQIALVVTLTKSDGTTVTLRYPNLWAAFEVS